MRKLGSQKIKSSFDIIDMSGYIAKISKVVVPVKVLKGGDTAAGNLARIWIFSEGLLTLFLGHYPVTDLLFCPVLHTADFFFLKLELFVYSSLGGVEDEKTCPNSIFWVRVVHPASIYQIIVMVIIGCIKVTVH